MGSRKTARSASPRRSPKPRASPKETAPAEATKKKYASGTNFVEGGVDENPLFLALVFAGPVLCQVLAFVTSAEMKAEPYLSELLPQCFSDLSHCASSVLNAALSVQPTIPAVKFLLGFMSLALLLEFLPGKLESGPQTQTGHTPTYVDNGVKHCLLFSVLFVLGSNLGPLEEGLYDFGVMFDLFVPAVATLNIFGISLAIFLTIKGLTFPSTADSGTTGSLLRDVVWGTELYPRVFGLDIKRFINCRFSMTFWMLAGFSFTYRSYTLHGAGDWKNLDWGLLFSAISQYLYLFKFFWWEMGYMRSIDIIVDRAGFSIQWGCLVFVPAVYTLHTRYLVLHPSGMSFGVALSLFVLSLAAVALNYAADRERDVFRATNGKALVWGKPPRYITAQYSVTNPTTGKETKRTSLLLASGFWGMARHFQYFFELVAAWSWCLLANPLVNGLIPLWYATFLTTLLIDRAKRDSIKCHKKYGKFYADYCRLVPYKIIPGVY